MVVTFNILHIFGLAKPISEALNAKRNNKVLWNTVQSIGLLLALTLAIPLLTIASKIWMGSISPADPTVLVVPCLIIVELITIEATTVAGWYTEGHKLILYPGGSWMMLKVN